MFAVELLGIEADKALFPVHAAGQVGCLKLLTAMGSRLCHLDFSSHATCTLNAARQEGCIKMLTAVCSRLCHLYFSAHASRADTDTAHPTQA